MKKLVLLLIMFLSVECFAQTSNDYPPPPPPVKSKKTKKQKKKEISDSTDTIFQTIEVEAEFPGGMKAWSLFIAKNLNPNVPSNNGVKKAKSYMVVVRFTVNKEGKVTDVIAETKFGYGMEQEAVRVISLSPDWKPGYMDGTAVSTIKRQPVIFKVEFEK